MQQSDLPPPGEDLAKWEAEFNQLMNAQRDDAEYDYGAAMQQAWESGQGETSQAMTFDDDGMPILGKYIFGMIQL